MSEKFKFKVFNSPVYILGKIEIFIMIFIPLLLRDALSMPLCLALCGFFALVWLYYLLSTSAVVFVDADGISCRRALGKTTLLKWGDIVCSGSFNKTVYGKEIRFRYFSSKKLQRSELGDDTVMPKLSDSLIFVTETSELDAAVKQHFSKGFSKAAPDKTDSAAGNTEKLRKLITADFAVIFAMCAVYLMRRTVLQTAWLPVLIVLCVISVVLSAAIIKIRTK